MFSEMTIPDTKKAAIDSFFKEFKQHVTVLLGEDVLITYSITKNTIDKYLIQQLVCNAFKVPFSVIRSPTRGANISLARMTYIYLCRAYTKLTFAYICSDINKHHASGVNACQRVADWLEIGDPEAVEKVQPLINYLNNLLKDESKKVSN